MAEVSIVRLPSDECHWTLLMISQPWFRWWLGAVRQLSQGWPRLCRHMVSLGHNESMKWYSVHVWSANHKAWYIFTRVTSTYCWLLSCYILSCYFPKSIEWNLFNSLWPSDAIWRHRLGSTLAWVMACCLTAPSHYLNHCWLITSTVQWYSSEGNLIRYTSATNQ